MPEKLKLTFESYFEDPEVQKTKMTVIDYIDREIKSCGFDISTMSQEELDEYFDINHHLILLNRHQIMILAIGSFFTRLGFDPMEIINKKFENNKNDLFNFDTNNN